jgi:hypothetical protein
MKDLLGRLQRALPHVQEWISDLHTKHAPNSVAAGAMGFARLAHHFPAEILQSTRAVAIDVVPFPPVADLGLPELEELARMPMAGITFGDMYFVRPEHSTEPIHFHELVHVVQWATLGPAAFLSTYAVGIAKHGYEASPLEMAASDLQARFERGEALRRAVDFVRWHAGQCRAGAAELFDSLGMTMDASR